ncbi:MAG: L-threonylcarbamoyladenylate synthase [Bacteroidia bacterium]
MQTVIGADLHLAAALLSKGEVVAIPTETVYGLAANALDVHAALKIFEAKQRPSFDPLIVHISGADQIHKYATGVPLLALELAEAFWPGPLTIVLPKKDVIPDVISSGLPTVGLRCPAHPVTRELLHAIDFPLAAPSANPFGYISPTTAQHVFDQLQNVIPYILDGGPCKIGVESTIVGFEDDGVFVYRLGGLTLEELQKIAPEIRLKINSSSNPQAPGMLASHYAPRKKMLLGNIGDLLELHQQDKAAVLSFSNQYAGNDKIIACEVLSRAGDLFEAAAGLFAALRRLDSSEADFIIAEPVPDVSIGRAINDRLRRAAG